MTVDMVGTVLAAKEPVDLFGRGEPETLKPLYRRLMGHVHPDRNRDPRAPEAFDKLQKLWLQLNGGSSVAAGKVTIQTRKHIYELGELRSRNAVANTYNATYDDGRERCLVKIARSPSDGDLVRAEAASLRALHEIDRYREYHPELIDTFRHRDSTSGVTRAALALAPLPDGLVPLAEIDQLFPAGLDGRDLAWIVRRALVAIGVAHDAGRVHGGVSLASLLIQPEQHGVVLTDWEASVALDSPLSFLGADRSAYPRYALEKKPVDYKLDIWLLAIALRRLVGTRGPSQFRSFFNGCMVSSVPPAGYLLEEFDDLLERLYGRRTFRPFVIPERGE